MSAENELVVYLMENGQFWICIRRTMEYMGECTEVVRACGSYALLARAFREVTDRHSPHFAYTEYGGRLPSLAELRDEPPRFLRSTVVVHRARWRWEVREYRDAAAFRVVSRHRKQARASEVAHYYAYAQPGIVTHGLGVQDPPHRDAA